MAKREPEFFLPARKRIAPEPARHRYFYGRFDVKCCHDPTKNREASLFFLSNFANAKFIVDGKSYATSEHFYQSQKFLPHAEQYSERVRTAVTSAASKALTTASGSPGIRLDWDVYRLTAMRIALQAKFSQNLNMRAQLLATDDAILHEDAPRDQFWGVSGQDMLGKMLCELREQFQKEDDAEDKVKT